MSLGALQRICNSGSTESAAYSTNDTFRSRFLNRTLYVREENRGLTRSEKIARVREAFLRINRNHLDQVGYSADQMAQAIVWAADCTGNDFQVFAGLLLHESYMCRDRHNEGGGDSGCGQFTSAAFNEMRAQMHLAGTDRGNVETSHVMHQTVQECYGLYDNYLPGSYDNGQRPNRQTFTRLMGSDLRTIRTQFRNGSAMHVDLISTAMYLKFHTARLGGYTVPGTSPGGLAAYNGGGVSNYSGRVSSQLNNIGLSCTDDRFSPEIMMSACEFGPANQVESCKAAIRREMDAPVEQINYDGGVDTEV